jgi:hypothetical protein
MATTPLYDDRPLDNPENDLLGMDPYAKELAHYLYDLSPPYTVGVYGEWGSGKTTYVSFARRYLEEQFGQPDEIIFISFTAWPHATSDELWRALILTIARALYGIPEGESPQSSPSPTPPRPGWWEQLADWLKADALPIYQPPPEPDPLAGYHQLLERLDQTDHGSISRDARQHLQIDQQKALLAVVRAATGALSTVSPLIAGIRGLLGLDKPLNLSEVFQQERNKATRESIKSQWQFIRLIQQVFEDQAGDKKVFIFIDDLDRCLPDVALDVLEAVKVFLGEVPAIFLVAADEKLIGQGLRLRYRDLPEESIDFAQKGREYFEKIIQFNVRVPERKGALTHDFLVAQFPHWLPATDLIAAAIGDNPRRLKQFGNYLTYEYQVLQTKAAPPRAIP